MAHCFIVQCFDPKRSFSESFLIKPPFSPYVFTRNGMPDYGSEVMAEALAQRALVKPIYTIPIIPLSNSNQYRHQDHMDMKDYKTKVRDTGHKMYFFVHQPSKLEQLFRLWATHLKMKFSLSAR